MRIRAISASIALAIACALINAPAFAQRPNPQSEREFQNYLNHHPELRANPEMMTNPGYLKQHPGFSKWMEQHPAVAAQSRRMGAYDTENRWHNSEWWQDRDPEWVYKHHPEWANEHPQWWKSYGDYDPQHRWHDSEWWETHNRAWAEEHHPGWFKHHRGHDND
jgi:hypothetical protein